VADGAWPSVESTAGWGDHPTVVTTGDGSPTLYHPAYQQTYRSLHGAVAESEHVFLNHSQVVERFRERQATAVLEIGFGTGLNFQLTAMAARHFDAALRFVSIERDLVSAETFQQLWHAYPLGEDPKTVAWGIELRSLLARMLADGSTDHRGGEDLRHHLDWTPVRLEVIQGDATRIALPPEMFDAIYLDGFSPPQNPELWTAPFLASLAKRLKPGGHLVSFCVQGAVRRALQDGGLVVQRLAGPPSGKRHCLVATAPQNP